MRSVIGIPGVANSGLKPIPLTSASLVPRRDDLLLGCGLRLISPLQIRVVNEQRRRQSRPSTLNQGAFNLGNAAGAWIGGLALTNGLAIASCRDRRGSGGAFS